MRLGRAGLIRPACLPACYCPALHAADALANKRNWLIFEDARQTLDARAFDRAVAQVNDGTAQVRKLSGESIRGFVVDGQKIRGQAVLEYVLEGCPARRGTYRRPARPSPAWSASRAPFAESARAFAERMRLLLAGMISTTCCIAGSTVACAIRIREQGQRLAGTLGAQGRSRPRRGVGRIIPFRLLVAICDLVRPSYASVSAERIFNQVTQLVATCRRASSATARASCPGNWRRFAARA